MTVRGKSVLGVSTLLAVLALAGCQADTAIATVNAPKGGQPDGGDASETGGPETSQPDTSPPDTSSPDSPPPACPPGPMAPLGVACSSPGQLCPYGYNPIECGGRTVVCKDGRWAEESHRDPQAACFDAGARPDASGDADATTEDAADSGG